MTISREWLQTSFREKRTLALLQDLFASALGGTNIEKIHCSVHSTFSRRLLHSPADFLHPITTSNVIVVEKE